MEVEFGKIQEILEDEKDDNNDPIYCSVVPELSDNVITQKLYIPWYWRARFGNLQVDDIVCYAIKGNGQGCVLSRLDGEFDGTIRNEDGTDLTITGNVVINGNITINGDTQIDGNTSVDGKTTLNGENSLKGKTTISGTLQVDKKVGGASDALCLLPVCMLTGASHSMNSTI